MFIIATVVPKKPVVKRLTKQLQKLQHGLKVTPEQRAKASKEGETVTATRKQSGRGI